MARRLPPYAPVIRFLRQARGLSPEELARRIGQPDYYVGYLEEGYRRPRLPVLEALAAAFGWHPFELALVAEEPIPYPDWPASAATAEWTRLADEWATVVDAIDRYVTARALLEHPEWWEEVGAGPEVRARAQAWGLVAVYDWLRERWQPLGRPAARQRVPAGPADIRARLEAGPLPPAAPEPLPPWLAGLPERQRRLLARIAGALAEPEAD
ncbi:putative HTH cro/C1-type domain-containing protein [Candidatus Hydrogenisulfobacillus filiaventi]|uniref:Putative HTH cro/C1-type domain-containing protein n=1 Tax=Candidatus Hydrogenisulfobacillus filiaventi TaxID=2707344 RepID=A0A6F8ZHH4_9FIRM|nr:putative HTH cro/C1-type domain-containing protein [Candidatus Hydrogenisulfobacillus filiaventi]